MTSQLELENLLATDLVEPQRATRARKPYKEATQRPKTMNEVLAWETSDLFGDFDFGERPTLDDMYQTMKELNAVKGTNGLKAVSLFSGCAGSGTGFAWSGWEELMAVEFVKAARESIHANYPSNLVEPDDITKYVHKWIVKNESSLEVEFTKVRNLKKHKHESIVNWEVTIEKAAARHKATGDEKVLEDLIKLRYDTSYKALKKVNEKGKITLWGDDIRGLDPQAFMDVYGLKRGELDCLEGSPPCKSFSMSGIREGGWGQILHYSDERNQRTDDLFMEYVRMLKTFMPKTFIAENVAGMMMGTAGTDVVVPLLQEFDRMGYRVEAKILNSKDYGVPQSRPRVFFVGIRKDLVKKEDGSLSQFTWPNPNRHVYVLQDVLDVTKGKSPEAELKFANIEFGPSGKEYEAGRIWKSLDIGAAPENKAYQLMRCHPNLPVPTITATSANNSPAAGPTHPYECRKFTVTEYRYLFGFPSDYLFIGDLSQQGERMGRSVTPYVMKQISAEIAKVILNSKLDGSEF